MIYVFAHAFRANDFFFSVYQSEEFSVISKMLVKIVVVQYLLFILMMKHWVHSQNQVFLYTRCISLKHVASLQGPTLHLQATQLLKKCCSGGKLLATLCPI